MIVLLATVFEPAAAVTAATLAGSATGRRFEEPLRSVRMLRAPMREICAPQRERDYSKTHRNGGHP
jgi:hypothetical protein